MGFTQEAASKLVSCLPTVGALVGSVLMPGGGIAIGAGAGKAVQAVAEFLGVAPEPEALNDAILAASPEKMMEMQLKLKELDTQLEVERLRAEVGILKTVNQTMRVEAQSEHWAQWGWRPFWGFISGFAFLYMVIVIGVAILEGKLATVRDVIEAMDTMWYVPLAILGVAAWGRNKLKERRIESGLPNAKAERTGLLKKAKDWWASRKQKEFSEEQ